MPIPYEKLTYNDILHNQAAYECFDKAGKELFPDWDIIGFEKSVLGCGDNHYLFMAEQIKESPNLFSDLNKTMPFLRFREKGQHFGYELFLSPPKNWGSRGAPLWWAYAARKFTYDKLPIFINRFGQAQHQATLNKAIRRIIRDCNDEQFEKSEEPEVLLPHFSCHSLRHTFTTRMCEAGVNIKVIQDALGHTDISTTLNIYTDVTKELKTSEFKGLDNYFKAQ